MQPLHHSLLNRFWFIALTAGLCLGGTAAGQTAQRRDVELQVGIVQRFGSEPIDTVTLQAPAGDRLTVRFQTNGKAQTIAATSAKLDVVMQPLPQSRVEERVVFSTHRSFESAEEVANRWQAAGIPVEVAQPERWQVWAKRDVYRTPLLRRLLLQSVQARGVQTAHLDSRVVQKQPRASIVVNGYRFTRDQLDISTSRGAIQVGVGREPSRLYAGSLRLQPNTYGTYTLVNQVPLEAYLRGVVPYEIGTWAPQPVLEAQAILARTYALRNLRRFGIDGYQLCADTQCQVYSGLNGAAASTDRAIAATAGQVLTYNNELVDALYSSTTGGVTASFSDVWYGPDRPYLRTVVDSVTNQWDLSRQSLSDERNFRRFINQKKGFNEDTQELFRWRVSSRLEEMNRDLRQFLSSKKHPMAGFKTIQRLEVAQRSPGGRVLRLAVVTDQGTLNLEKDELLLAFEAPNSTLFYLDPIVGADRTIKGYTFVGGGFGHGVGLSQTGSYHLGKLGWSSNRILSFYFPGTQLQPISDAIVFWRNPGVNQIRSEGAK